MDKKRFSRNFRYPSAELRDQVRAAVKERGFRSEQAFLIAACEHEIRQGANTEATEQFEARVRSFMNRITPQPAFNRNAGWCRAAPLLDTQV